MNESVIASVLVRPFGRFPPRKFLAVENVSWGLLPWEADLIVMSANGYLQEIEIKISVADLARDLKKRKHLLIKYDAEHKRPRGHNSWIRRFWYAMPEAVWDKVKAAPPIPDHAGVMIIRRSSEISKPWEKELFSEEVRGAKLNKDATPLAVDEQYTLARLGVLRYWDRIASPAAISGDKQEKERG